MPHTWNVVIDSTQGSLTFGFTSREDAETFWRLVSEKWQEGNLQAHIDSSNGPKTAKSSDLKGVWLTSWDEDDVAVSVAPSR